MRYRSKRHVTVATLGHELWAAKRGDTARRLLIVLASLLLAGPVFATSIPSKSLEELVADADCIVAATVTQVSMIDGRGRAVVDREAKTGPGLEHQIRLHLTVDSVLRSKGVRMPATILVPLWSMWHYRLGHIIDIADGSTGIFLLNCDGFEPVYPAGFQRLLSERERIERVIEAVGD